MLSINYTCSKPVTICWYTCTNLQASRKKVYMLYDLKPDESVTGGAWYSEQDFDYDFVEVLSANCLKFLKQKVW